MPRFQYMNFPFPFYKAPTQLQNGFYNSSEPIKIGKNSNITPATSATVNNSPRTDSRKPSYDIPKTNLVKSNNDIHTADLEKLNIEERKQKNKSNNNPSDYLFDLFGLKIYSDDVLLVSLIYFLYTEGVKDDGLFLVLVLLLLS